jgi:hypothetical protein
MKMQVWSSYKRQEIESTIDPTIIETRDKEKALRCIHVGLLCTQADSLRRPPMSEVTAMLSNSVTLPVPTKPPVSPSPSNFSFLTLLVSNMRFDVVNLCIMKKR